MAEAEMVVVAPSARATQVLGGMGILRLLRGWPSDQVAAGGRADAPVNPPAAPANEPLALTLIAWPEPELDRRASSLALARTLADWRAGERKLELMVMDSLDWTRTVGEVEALRATHHRLFGQLRRGI